MRVLFELVTTCADGLLKSPRVCRDNLECVESESTGAKKMGKGKKSGTERRGQLFLTLFRTCTRINPRPTQPHHPRPSLLPPHPFGRNIPPQKSVQTHTVARNEEWCGCVAGCGSSTDARVELRRSTPPPAESERRRDLEIPKRPEPRYAVLPLFLYLLYLSILPRRPNRV
jgi:hypothetical protein